jgi:hypothetical protein
MARRKVKKLNKFLVFLKEYSYPIIVGIILLGCILFAGSLAHACTGPNCSPDSAVYDTNNGQAGQILVNNGCADSGNKELGTWTNPSDIPGLKGDKGDKGDKGATGAQGIQGIKGEKGDQGEKGNQGFVGNNGKDGTNGIDGKDGKDGAVGAKGDQGDMGLPGTPGAEGEKGDKGEQGIQGIKGVDFDPATLNEQNSKLDNMNSRINKLERTQYVFQGEVRLFDTRKWTGKPFVRYNIQRHKVDTVGFILTYKMGKSYEERQMELLNKRLDRLEKEQPAVIEKVYNADGTLRQISIHE